MSPFVHKRYYFAFGITTSYRNYRTLTGEVDFLVLADLLFAFSASFRTHKRHGSSDALIEHMVSNVR